MSGDIVGSLISGGFGLTGGLLSDASQRSIAAMNWERQKEALHNTIQWRVEDAKKAGIHPLYALGAPTFNAPAQIYGGTGLGEGLRDMGQNLGGAIARTMDADEKKKTLLEIEGLEKRNEEMDARTQLLRTQEQQIRAPSAPTGIGIQREGKVTPGEITIEGQTYNPTQGTGRGYFERTPGQRESQSLWDKGVAAGDEGMYQVYWLTDGLPFLGPAGKGESAEEILSEMSWPAYYGLVVANANKFGVDWLEDFLAYRYAGRPPKNYHEHPGERTSQPYHYPDSLIWEKVKRYGREAFEDMQRRWDK